MWMNPDTTTITAHNHSNIPSPQLYKNSLYSRRSSISHNPTTTACYPDSDAYLDIDSEIKSQASTSSSPQSTAGSFPLSTFDSLPPSTTPRTPQSALFEFRASAPQSQFFPGAHNMMYADTWSGDINQFVPKSSSRSAHNRDSSLSSLGSFGPASPFTFNSSNPHIAVSDASDYQGLSIHDDQTFHLAAKAPNATSHDTFYANYPYSDNASVQAYTSMLAPQKHRGDRSAGGLLPPPEFSNGGSRPGSVASSVASDSPATPAAPEPAETEEARRRKTGENFFLTELLNLDESSDSHLIYDAGMTAVPKLDRTMTDIFSDELYNPNFQFTSAPPPSQPSQSVASPTNEMFAQRIQAANNQHLTATSTQEPMSGIQRGRSPFRNGSPLAPKPSQAFSPQVSSNIRFNTAQHMREQKKQEDTAHALRQITQSQNAGTPQTISPKDAVLEFTDDDNNNFPLFPQQPSSSGFNTNQMPKSIAQANNFNNLALDTEFDNYLTSQLSASQLSNGMQLPQQYPFVAKQSQPSLPSATSFSMSSRMESSGSPSSIASGSPQRPDHVGAEGGTYTCTYHGCSQRFETPALLQKHKREGHRQAHGLNGLRRPDVSPTGSNFFNTQAGPHKCERINPSTGKPCNTIFSRPYDLTRHEDTIHNGRKQKVRCDVCTEEKTFSRADALTRHYRVCHPDLEFPGKHRKRGGAAN